MVAGLIGVNINSTHATAQKRMPCYCGNSICLSKAGFTKYLGPGDLKHDATEIKGSQNFLSEIRVETCPGPTFSCPAPLQPFLFNQSSAQACPDR